MRDDIARGHLTTLQRSHDGVNNTTRPSDITHAMMAFRALHVFVLLAALLLAFPSSVSGQPAPPPGYLRSYGDECVAGKQCLEQIDQVNGFDLCAVSNGKTGMQNVGQCGTSNYDTCATNCNNTMYGFLDMKVNGKAVVSNVSELSFVCIKAASREKINALCPGSVSPAAGRAGALAFLLAVLVAALVVL